jgi:hypothetical protein
MVYLMVFLQIEPASRFFSLCLINLDDVECGKRPPPGAGCPGIFVSLKQIY